MQQLVPVIAAAAIAVLLAGLAVVSGADSRSWEDPRPWWPGRRGGAD